MSELIDLNARATQVRFAQLVGVSQQAISERVAAGVLPAGGTLGDWLLAYCERLRTEAAGRGGDDQAALTRARTREAEASAQLKELQIMERAGQLVPGDEIEPQLQAMVTAARTELLALPDALAQELRALYGVEIDASLIEERIHVALAHLADRLQDDLAGDVDAGGAGVGTAA